MPTAVTYPGVYIEEVPSGVRTIVGVPTSITAFVGFARRGPVDDPSRIQSWGDYDRRFGGLSQTSTLSYAVQQFFANGGADAIVVRVVHREGAGAASTATLTLGAGNKRLVLAAASPGEWANGLRVRIEGGDDVREAEPGENADQLFNLRVHDPASGTREDFLNLNVASSDEVIAVAEQSQLIRVTALGIGTSTAVTRRPPDPHGPADPGVDPLDPPEGVTGTFTAFTANGDDGADGTQAADDLIGSDADKEGIYALRDADIFNMLCIPPVTRDGTLDVTAIIGPAAKLCAEERAFLIVDPPDDWDDVAEARDNVDDYAIANRRNAAIYFPRINGPDPLAPGTTGTFPPCGAVAGLIARTDGERGVWKAPAGQDATLAGVSALSVALTDGENGQLNPLGINCLRTFEGVGHVVWGARTLDGADRNASEWKYVPIRRLALYIEESLYRGTRWAVFEPNDEPLWSQLRLNIGSFMHDLFRQGAFQGASPREAYFVKCDKETTTQSDRDKGIVNVLVGFAPLKPAEFVVLKISQIAGEREV
jgi:hypothetical protein